VAGCKRHPCFINTSHKAVALRPEFDLKSQQEVKALTFGSILTVSSANAFRELVRTLSLIDFQSFK
jgi:hypothetical protein